MAAPVPDISAELLARLDACGPYTFHRPSLLARWIGVPAEMEWESPAGFENALAPIAVTLWFSTARGRAGEELPRLLEGVNEFRRDLDRHIAAVESFVVDCFRDCCERELPSEQRQRLAGESGSISDAAILRDVRAIHLRFDATGKGIVRSAWLAIDWLGEEGLEIDWDEAGNSRRPWKE
jgi:hypothetical protein